jgi:MerR family transcriptional regulator/heat shock protein HspR
MLRIYEREGLVEPARSAGGTRRYSRRDIDRLAEICALTADGLNLAGIRRVLALQEETRQRQAEVARLRGAVRLWQNFQLLLTVPCNLSYIKRIGR